LLTTHFAAELNCILVASEPLHFESPTIDTVRLISRLTITLDPHEWSEIDAIEWTTQRDGGVVEGRVLIRRNADGRTLMYIDVNPGDVPFVRGDLLPWRLRTLTMQWPNWRATGNA
jgi:hypothetical protein